jgi:hypothetical protein
MPIRNETILISSHIRINIDNIGQNLHQRYLQKNLLFARVKNVQRGINCNDGIK